MPMPRPLAMLPVPLINTAAPQTRLSGLARGPLPLLVFDDDVPKVGAPQNCTLSFVKVPPRGNTAWLISGVTRDSAGAALGNCTVGLFTTTDNVLRYTTVSDASGNFSFSVPSNGWTFYAVAYLAGAPDVAGTTVNTLRGT